MICRERMTHLAVQQEHYNRCSVLEHRVSVELKSMHIMSMKRASVRRRGILPFAADILLEQFGGDGSEDQLHGW